MSAVASPYASPNLSRVGSQVSVVSGFQAQSQGSASGGRGGSVGLGGGGVGVVMQRHKNLVNMNAALMASAQGDWARAEEILRGLVDVNPDDFVVSHSFRAVSILFFVSLDTSPGFGFGSGSGSTAPLFRSRTFVLDRQRSLTPDKRALLFLLGGGVGKRSGGSVPLHFADSSE